MRLPVSVSPRLPFSVSAYLRQIEYGNIDAFRLSHFYDQSIPRLSVRHLVRHGVESYGMAVVLRGGIVRHSDADHVLKGSRSKLSDAARVQRARIRSQDDLGSEQH